jgi:chemotaxis protein MotB
MPKRKKRDDGGGVPEWVVTYGDMMSLLLCFFILLAAFSELKRDQEFQRVISAVKEAFGYSGGVGVMPTNDPPLRSMIETLEELAIQGQKASKVSQADERGMRGKRTRVTRVHDGIMFTIGGSLTFEPGSAELKPEAEAELLKIARILRGRNNKIEVRGHAASKALPPDAPFADLRDLSYFRAKAVAAFLVADGQLREPLLVVDARGDSEPVALRRYAQHEQTENRRVEIVMTETVASELNKDELYSSEAVARGEEPG